MSKATKPTKSTKVIDYISENGMQFRRPDGDGIPTTADETYHTISRFHLPTKYADTFPLVAPKTTNVYKLVNHWNRQPNWKFFVES